MARILYIEDDKEIGQWIKSDLTERGHEVTWRTSGENLENHLDRTDLAILDIMLSGLDGFSIGRRIKKEYPETPIVMLSARSGVEDKIEGLSFADDYVTKPFHPEELAARVEALLRRFQKQQDIVEISHLKIDTKTMVITNKKTAQEILLTGKQFQLFQYFLRHLNQILTKEQLYEAIWKSQFIEGDKTLMVHIRYLREKIEDNPAKPNIIETIRGIGYRVKQ